MKIYSDLCYNGSIFVKGYIMDYTDTELQQQLKENLLAKEMCITFTKVNGEIRTMRCTLNSTKIAEYYTAPAKEKNPRAASTTSLAVFDLDKRQWRSFKYENIINVT